MSNLADIQYKITYSRRRTISIFVTPDNGVIVKAPLRTPVKTIQSFIDTKSDWIRRSIESFRSMKRIDNRTGYSDNDSVLLFGREHRLKLIPSTNYSVRLGEYSNTIELRYQRNIDPLRTKTLLENWFKFIAGKKLTHRFREILGMYGGYSFSPSGLTVRKMKKRWGSCSSKGKIALSYDLIRLDEKFSDYVIIHELCHLKHHNHSAEFYRFLSVLYPEWKKVRSELKEYIR